MVSYISIQVKFEDGDPWEKVKVTVTKKFKNTKKKKKKKKKKIAKNSDMYIYEFYFCSGIEYVITVILIPNMFIAYKKQGHKWIN